MKKTGSIEKALALITVLNKNRQGYIHDRPLGKGIDRTWRESAGYKSRSSRSSRRKAQRSRV